MTRPIPIETFRALDESLAKEMGRTWKKQYTRLVQLTARALDRNDQAAIEEAIQSFDLVKVFKRHRRSAEMIGMAAVFFGASRLTPVNQTNFAEKSEPEQVKAALDQFEKMMEELTEQVRRSAEKAVVDELTLRRDEEQTVQKAGGRLRRFTSFANKSVGKAGFSGIQIASSLHTSRLSSWGFTTEARLKGVTHYQVNEQLDGRICPVCREMHKKVFPVEPAHGRLDGILKERDTSKLKILAPWPKQDRASVAALKTMSAEELTSRGWDTPPYHPLCRGILKPVKGSKRVATPATTVTGDTRLLPVSRAPIDTNLADKVVDAIVVDGLTDDEVASSLGIAATLVARIRKEREID